MILQRMGGVTPPPVIIEATPIPFAPVPDLPDAPPPASGAPDVLPGQEMPIEKSPPPTKPRGGGPGTI